MSEALVDLSRTKTTSVVRGSSDDGMERLTRDSKLLSSCAAVFDFERTADPWVVSSGKVNIAAVRMREMLRMNFFMLYRPPEILTELTFRMRTIKRMNALMRNKRVKSFVGREKGAKK